MSDLKITIIQSDLYWENIAKNLDMFSEKISSISEPTDLIVLPEMFTTGFSMNPKSLAQSISGETIDWISKMAREKNSAITGSFICKENNKYFNRLIWMNPDGTYSAYDKRHLFRMGEENNHYSSGNKKLIVELKGWKICPLICYDLRFPVWSRNGANEIIYDVLIYVANWPKSRAHAWKTLLPARAIENQCYVIGVNRIGNDGNMIEYFGDSAVVSPRGEIVSKTYLNQENIETVVLKKEEILNFREMFPVLKDADKFTLL